ncbi:MAG TPA: sigma 54-interacting transcriptional regulator [Polyangiales bacterium]|nr:sigma 54-interacting transcriptional regulator [Polyangiales bacterium]
MLGWLIAAIALGLSFSARPRDSVTAPLGVRALPWLGFSTSVALLRALSDQPSRLSVGIAEVAGLCVLGASVFDQALRVPDRLGSLRFSRVARGLTYGLGAASALVSSLALAGFSQVPGRYASAAACYAGLCVIYALCVRLLRPRLGSSPDALASNAWGSLALAPAAALAILAVFPELRSARPFMPLWAASAALALYFGHAFMVDPKRRLSASRFTRDSLAASCALLLMAGGVAAFGKLVPRSPLPLALWTAATLLVALGLFFSLRALARQQLAPFGGRLLRALSEVESSLAGVQTREELARIVLGALRDASGSRAAQPVLYGFEPGFEARLDAAGAAHVREQAPNKELLVWLEEQPGEILVRASLEARIVRSPLLRPLLEVLQEHDVLCAVPLVAEGQLEGAFLLPRGGRRSPLTLEELNALRRHARWLTGLFTLFASRSRSELRAHNALQANIAASRRVQELGEENARAREALALLHGGRMRRTESPALIAYSPAMRALQAHLRTLTALESPVLLVAEPGLPVEPLARFLHVEAGRPAEPFVVMDCAALRTEQAEGAIFGSAAVLGEDAGCLRAADAGSLLLLDIVALPRSVQRRLATTLITGIARPAGGGLPYRVHARVVASARAPLRELVEQGRCEPELAAPFEAFVCRVPPLRECPEDFESHVLLAIDRACKRLAREPIGIEPGALERLRAEQWTENVAQLQTVLDRAASVTTGPRITSADLERSHALSAGAHPLEGHLDEVERRALLHALARTGNNKSEAARLLGIPRTTLLDKLRRHKLDEPAREAPPSAPN